MSCETNLKFTKTLAAVTVLNNALEELKTNHGVDTDDKFQEEIFREIIFHNLPVPIRQGLIDKFGKNYPSSKEMLEKFEDVVTKLDLLESYNPSKNVAKVPKVNASNTESNDLTTINNVNHSNTTVHKCLFCDKIHYFWKCDYVVEN